MSVPASRFFLACILGAAMLAPSPARANLSPSNHWVYNLDQLHENDWRTLGRQLVPLSARGAMALVFADGTAPITDQAEVKRWVETGRPLRAVAFPGISGDAVAAFSLAKDVAIANHASDGANAPVLAVNSGWTDSYAPMGHALEASGLIPSIGRGEGYPHGPSHAVAQMLRTRFAVTQELVGLVGHSAGCFYAANTAWLLGAQQRKALRIYNVGVATHVPPGIQAVQRIGTTDVLGLVNSTHAGLGGPGTRVEEGLSHLAGSASMWKFGDSRSTHAWHVESFADAFSPRAKTPDQGRAPSREVALRRLGEELENRGLSSEQLAARNAGWGGVKQLLGVRLRHDAAMLRLRSERAIALADWLAARSKKDTKKLAAAKRALAANRAERSKRSSELREARVLKTPGTDQIDYAMMFGDETLASMDPIRMWNKLSFGMTLPLAIGHRALFAWSEALMGLARPAQSDAARAAALTDQFLNVRRQPAVPKAVVRAVTTTRSARRPVAPKAVAKR